MFLEHSVSTEYRNGVISPSRLFSIVVKYCLLSRYCPAPRQNKLCLKNSNAQLNLNIRHCILKKITETFVHIYKYKYICIYIFLFYFLLLMYKLLVSMLSTGRTMEICQIVGFLPGSERFLRKGDAIPTSRRAFIIWVIMFTTQILDVCHRKNFKSARTIRQISIASPGVR